MSYLVQNYFNNFQVRNPILKNPVNHSAPLQLSKVRPSQLATGATSGTTNLIAIQDINCGALRVTPQFTATSYVLPSANQLINLMGVQSNGLSTPTYQNAVQTGDVLILPVINTGLTGCTIVAGANVTGSNESTGTLVVPNVGSGRYGNISTLVIDFNYVSAGPSGVSGSYIVYGQTGPQ